MCIVYGEYLRLPSNFWKISIRNWKNQIWSTEKTFAAWKENKNIREKAASIIFIGSDIKEFF